MPIDAACEPAPGISDRDEGQVQLFGAQDPEVMTSDASGGRVSLPDAAGGRGPRQLAFEKETLGLYRAPSDRSARAGTEGAGARATNELADAGAGAARGLV
jgi:hypothetical protein